MANQYINKVIYGGKTLIDLSGDTVSADKLLKGLTAHDKSGAVITGTCTFDVDSGDADVAVAEILEGKIAYARGAKVTGTMPNKGAVTGVIAAVADSFTIPLGVITMVPARSPSRRRNRQSLSQPTFARE